MVVFVSRKKRLPRSGPKGLSPGGSIIAFDHIEVAVALPVDRTFTYGVPEILSADVAVGKRVWVPFRNRRVAGYVLGPGRTEGGFRLLDVLDVLDDTPLFPPEMVDFFRWVADYYIHPLGMAIHGALPKGLNPVETRTAAVTETGRAALDRETLTPLQERLLGRLRRGPLRLRSLKREFGEGVPLSLIRRLEEKGWVKTGRETRPGSIGAKTERWVTWTGGGLPREELSPARRRILAAVEARGAVPARALKAEAKSAPALVRLLAQAGYLAVTERRVHRDPFGEPIRADVPPELTRRQEKVVAEVAEALSGGFSAHLLVGVTGSGKTEVYMHLAALTLEMGRVVLVLVPEIALITQMERRFRARFGERVAVLHSGLSAGQRYDQWGRIAEGAVPIAIGVRSAVFAPLSRPGLIIVDEEHDASYKQEGDLFYNARDLAVVRAQKAACPVLLGSATPSVQSYYNVTTGKFNGLALDRRVAQRPLPEIDVVDLRKTRDNRGARRYITETLQEAMGEALSRGEQVLLFLNRRGFANLPVCAACGESLRCAHCDITLTFHQRVNAYKCHYCGFSRSSAGGCGICGSDKIKLLGFGTEKVEGAASALFPEARTARMDRDTTTRKGSILKLLQGVRTGEIDVLVGTQMVAKGHDFPNITLVGIICADLSLSFPDFRAGERTFQLLAQVAGRAGRGDAPGRVILQTFNPNHFSIVTARHQDFKSFFDREIGFRRALAYPPFSRLIQFKIRGRDPETTRDVARELGERCHGLRRAEDRAFHGLTVLGPIEAALAKVADHYRWQILLKGRGSGPLHRFVRRLMADNPALFGHRRVTVSVDVDPFFMF